MLQAAARLPAVVQIHDWAASMPTSISRSQRRCYAVLPAEPGRLVSGLLVFSAEMAGSGFSPVARVGALQAQKKRRFRGQFSGLDPPPFRP